jgi:hypothetical protein
MCSRLPFLAPTALFQGASHTSVAVTLCDSVHDAGVSCCWVFCESAAATEVDADVSNSLQLYTGHS